MTRLSVVVLLSVACHAAPPASGVGLELPPDASAPTSSKEGAAVPIAETIYQAFVASPMNAATTRTVFVFLPGAAALDADRKAQPYVIAREAYFEVVEDGGLAVAQPFTAFPPSGATCVGRAERKVLIRTKPDESAPPKIQRGLVLEGCDPSANVYAVHVVPGAHPAAEKLTATLVAPGAGPTWASGQVQVHRFAQSEPLFVVVRELDGRASAEWQIGTATRINGTILVQRDPDPPILFAIDGRLLVVGGGTVASVGSDSIAHLSDLESP
ncbi:hypothetical protein BH09MYX1_BH09MYX1_46260 [soil metagenome]